MRCRTTRSTASCGTRCAAPTRRRRRPYAAGLRSGCDATRRTTTTDAPLHGPARRGRLARMLDRLAAVTIGPAIRRARTLPAWLYSDPAVHALQRERVFARSWQWAGDADRVKVPGAVCPVTLLEGGLDEPLVLARDRDDALHCYSNVCTHRGTLVCEREGVENFLRCRYHGRRFALDGRFLSMPEFEGVEGFPSPADDLPKVPFGQIGKLLFGSLAPSCPFDELVADVRTRCGFLPWDRTVFDASRSREYLVQANWALYCDNYLEGFHIPYVHAGLAQAIDYSSYRCEVFRW